MQSHECLHLHQFAGVSGILAHHRYLRVSTTRHCLALKLACLDQMTLKLHLAKDSVTKDARMECNVGPTSTLMELGEELLASNSADQLLTN